MSATDFITQSRLKQLLHYDPHTGVFTWKVRPSNCIRVGDVAGRNCNGYVRIQINSVRHYAHRLAFLYMLGKVPDEVDHINHTRDDNRWCNLRAATSSVNSKNQSMNKTNTSGITGVGWSAQCNKWHAQIKINGKSINLGRFHDLNKAKAARRQAESDHGFHANHGAAVVSE
jgi:hypothetical protein